MKKLCILLMVFALLFSCKKSDEEKLSGKVFKKTEVITTNTEKEISKIEAQIGSPEVFQDLNFDGENEEIRIPKISKKLFRDEQNGMISGVAAGLAQYLKIDTVWVRLALVVMFFVSFGAIVPIYILSILIIPAAKNTNDILRLRGEVITASAIREVNEEYNFEKNAARNMKIARIFGIIFGIFTVFVFPFLSWL